MCFGWGLRDREVGTRRGIFSSYVRTNRVYNKAKNNLSIAPFCALEINGHCGEMKAHICFARCLFKALKNANRLLWICSGIDDNLLQIFVCILGTYL